MNARCISLLMILFIYFSCRKNESRIVEGKLIAPDDSPLEGFQIMLLEKKLPTIIAPFSGYKEKFIHDDFTDANGRFLIQYNYNNKSGSDYIVVATINKNINGTITEDTLPHGKITDVAELKNEIVSSVVLNLTPLGFLVLQNNKISITNDSLFIKTYHVNAKNTDGYYSINHKQFMLNSTNNTLEKKVDLPIGKIIMEWWIYSNNILQSSHSDSILLKHGERKEYLIQW